MVEYKGYEYLIKAAQYLSDDHVILIGGGGPLKNQLQQLIDTLGVNGKVELMGFVSDEERVACFMACDVFALSSIWKTEAFGIVQIEAMSCGKPVVATCIEGSGVSWVNADGVSGYNVEPQNAEALAEAIRKLLSDPQQYAGFSKRARARYETMFTQEKMIDNCLKLYEEVLRTKQNG
jgi:rhamnosyl/mannosyltransferase